MRSNYDKVLAHAEEKLPPGDDKRLSELVQVYKRFIKLEEHRLRLRHNAGGGGKDVAARRSQLVDVLLEHAYRQAARVTYFPESSLEHDFVVIATGGYGRGLLNPSSDVDIMFIYREVDAKLSATIQEVVTQMLYLFWDVGYKVGHAIRTIDETVAHCLEEPLSTNALLESRVVLGSRGLYAELMESFRAKVIAGHEQQYIDLRMQDQKDRHRRFGNTVYLQEPNVKNGCGGLRDFHNLIWISRVKYNVGKTADLIRLGLLSETEQRRLVSAYDFVLRVRTELHYLTGRANDVLNLYLQGKVAVNFKYPQPDILRQIEALMKDFYEHSRNIYLICGLLAERMSLLSKSDDEREPIFNFLARSQKDEERFDGFYSSHGLIYAEGSNTFREDPFRMMRVFQHAQVRELELSPRLRQRLRTRRYSITRTFQYSKTAREIFEAILSRKGEVGRILRMMHELDILGRYMPEFGQLTCLVQHEFFHRYTADEHTLQTIEHLDALLRTEDPRRELFKNLFRKLQDPFILYLALLLHDTGRAANESLHADLSALNAQRVSRRLQIDPQRRRLLIFLVDHHLIMSVTASRRNLNDPAVIEEFAKNVGSQDFLDAIMIMTLVDSQATGESTWNDWKESLILQLYHAASAYLADKKAFMDNMKVEKEGLEQDVAHAMSEDFLPEIHAHFASMPESYFRTYDKKQIIRHLKLIRSFFTRNFYGDEHALEPVYSWVDHPEQGHSEVVIACWDRQQLLARLVGSFAVANLNILSADINSREDDLVLDVFRVCTPSFTAVTNTKDKRAVERALNQALSNPDFDFKSILRKSAKQVYKKTTTVDQNLIPAKILINNGVSSEHTVVEVEAADRLGLLYDLVSGLYAHGLNIKQARIMTQMGAAIDSFDVETAEGKKVIQPSQIRAVQKDLFDRASRLGEWK
jgi:[protein-PII] uridylyltransferase